MRRGFGRRLGRGFRRRSVAWLPGFSGFDDVTGASARLMAFAGPVPGTTNTWGVASTLVGAADLPAHGGEDAVLSRIRGRLTFSHSQRNAGAGLAGWSAMLRIVVYQHQAVPAGTFNDAFTRSIDLGFDNILWTGEIWATSENLFDIAMGGSGPWMDEVPRVDIDVKAKRKVQEDRPIVLAFQTVLPAGTTAYQLQVGGGLRTLLMRPR